jgi:hypothetical protein
VSVRHVSGLYCQRRGEARDFSTASRKLHAYLGEDFLFLPFAELGDRPLEEEPGLVSDVGHGELRIHRGGEPSLFVAVVAGVSWSVVSRGSKIINFFSHHFFSLFFKVKVRACGAYLLSDLR